MGTVFAHQALPASADRVLGVHVDGVGKFSTLLYSFIFSSSSSSFTKDTNFFLNDLKSVFLYTRTHSLQFPAFDLIGYCQYREVFHRLSLSPGFFHVFTTAILPHYRAQAIVQI